MTDGEGQFELAGDVNALLAHGQLSLESLPMPSVNAISASHCQHEVTYTDNPNSSLANNAEICNERGNVFGVMPHPEHYIQELQYPQQRATAQSAGDGSLIFK